MDNDSYARVLAENVRLVRRDIIVTHRIRAVEALRDATRAAPGEAQVLREAAEFHTAAAERLEAEQATPVAGVA